MLIKIPAHGTTYNDTGQILRLRGRDARGSGFCRVVEGQRGEDADLTPIGSPAHSTPRGEDDTAAGGIFYGDRWRDALLGVVGGARQ